MCICIVLLNHTCAMMYCCAPHLLLYLGFFFHAEKWRDKAYYLITIPLLHAFWSSTAGCEVLYCLLLRGGEGLIVPFYLFIRWCWSSSLYVVLIYNYIIAPRTFKDDISANAFCHLLRCMSIDWYISKPS